MTEETAMTVQAPPFGGKPAWHGLYRVDGRWWTVRNALGNPIIYADEKSAQIAAEFMRDNDHHQDWVYPPDDDDAG